MLAIRAARLFDGMADQLRPRPLVLVDQGRIIDVDVTGADPPQGTELVDLGEVTLLPGLVDSHTHLVLDASNDPVGHLADVDDNQLLEQCRDRAKAALAAGITTLRDLGDRRFVTLRLREELAAHPERGPQLLVSGRRSPSHRYKPTRQRRGRGRRMRPSRSQVIGTLGAVALLAALVAVGRLNASGRLGQLPASVSTTATPPTPLTTVALPGPSQLRGVPLAGTGLAALLIPEPSSSAVPGLFWLDSGQLTPIGGLPRGGCYLPTTRLPHGWVLGQQANQGCPELGARTQFYRLADGASSATRLPVTADWVVGADDDTRLWLVDFLGQPDPASDQLPPQVIQQVDLTGHPHTPRYRVPTGYAAVQGVGGGLLLLVLAGRGPVDTSRFALWNPRSGRVLRRFDRVLAVTATTVAWVAGACGAKSCPVHLSDLASRSDTQVAAPRGMSAYTGAFRPDGRDLAVVFVSGDATAPAPPATPVRVGVIDASIGRLVAVSGAVMVGGGGDFWLRVTWSPDGAWLLLSAPAGQHPQLAAWRPGDTVFHVPRRQPPTGQHLVLAGF